MGEDCACEIDKYLNYKKLIKEYEFVIVARNMNLYMDSITNKFNKATYLHFNDMSSSSKFREAIKDIPTEVLKYIYENKLYLNKED